MLITAKNRHFRLKKEAVFMDEQVYWMVDDQRPYKLTIENVQEV